MLLSVRSINHMNINTATGGAAPTVALAVARYGGFGDCLALAATVNGVAPGERCELISVGYRGRSVAWVTLPTGTSHEAVQAALLSRADWFLGSRCPDMNAYPLSFE
jgi:hypothetical protein